jgi:Fe-S cluster assembly protein SufD
MHAKLRKSPRLQRIFSDRSTGVFNGKIFVESKKQMRFKSNNILLSDKATINAKPQLEIFADDVKCSHGCTIGQLDETAMFTCNNANS